MYCTQDAVRIPTGDRTPNSPPETDGDRFMVTRDLRLLNDTTLQPVDRNTHNQNGGDRSPDSPPTSNKSRESYLHELSV